MDIDSCYQIGYVIKRHGLKGEVRIHLESPFPNKVESIFIEIDNRLVPFFIETISVSENQAIVKLEEVDGPEKASQLSSCAVYLPNSFKQKRNYNNLEINDLIGFSVIFKKQSLGSVSAVNQHALNPLLVVSGNEKELLIPISDYFIKNIDYKLKNITVELPDGFTEI